MRAVPYPTLQRLVAVALGLHNVEEWLTFPRFGEIGSDMLRRMGISVAEPPWSVTQASLVLATVIPIPVVLFAATRTRSSVATWLVLFIQLQLGVNVLLPHVPAAVVAGGYAPGLVTAVAVNAPLSIALTRRTIAERRLSPRAVVLCLAAAAITMPAAIVLLVVVSGIVTNR